MKDSAAFSADSDAVAVERTLAGDRDAYRILVERHSRSLYRLAYRMTGDRHDAEDVVQEALLRAYQKLGQFSAQSNFGTWIYRIAANCALDRLKQRRGEEARREPYRVSRGDGPELSRFDSVTDDTPSPERLAQSGEWAAQIQRALRTLTPAERIAFVMRHWEGCGIEEISAALQASAGATKNTVFRAVQKLRQAMAPWVQTGRRAGAVEVEPWG